MNTEAVAQLVSVLEKTISPDQTELKEYTYLIDMKLPDMYTLQAELFKCNSTVNSISYRHAGVYKVP